MDNCPHQTVVACPPDVAATAQERLSERGIVCERLPFRRPYHTPLFEPFLAPIAAMYRSSASATAARAAVLLHDGPIFSP